MPKHRFLIDTGIIDSYGDIINFDGLIIPDKQIPVLMDFDISFNGLICHADISKGVDGHLVAVGDIPEETKCFYFGVGIKILSSEENEHGGKNITKAKLLCVGVSKFDKQIKKFFQ